jgi:hypothetical protein
MVSPRSPKIHPQRVARAVRTTVSAPGQKASARRVRRSSVPLASARAIADLGHQDRRRHVPAAFLGVQQPLDRGPETSSSAPTP